MANPVQGEPIYLIGIGEEVMIPNVIHYFRNGIDGKIVSITIETIDYIVNIIS
jgi:hypothetical protein